jgi:hypothetical protein
MADWTAITGIVVSGVVGPAVAARYAFRRSARDHEYARVLADRAELRTLLDDAEQAARQAGRLGETINGLFITHGRWTRERAGSQVDRFYEAGRAVDLQSGRLALRLTREHPVAKSYQDAFEGLLKVANAVGLAADLGEHANTREAYDAMKAGNSTFVAAHDRFLAGAQILVAAQLEPRRARGGTDRGTANPREPQPT